MKAKRLMMALLGAVLLLSLVATPALAAPPGYQEDPNPPWWSGGHKAIVTDSLVGATGNGYVRFLCQSQQGFEYSVGVYELSKGKYTVKAVSLPSMVDPPYWPTSDGDGVTYPLGTINVKPSGDGEVEGIVSLPLLGHSPLEISPGIYIYPYEWKIIVEDSDGNIVLATLPEDPAGFAVFP
jgi:hypothetical protein